jgi:predicted transcriptional regulator
MTIPQPQAVKQMLLSGMEVNASSVYQYTKKHCKKASVNHHKLIARLRDKGFVIEDKWEGKHEYKSFKLNRTKTSKKLLK